MRMDECQAAFLNVKLNYLPTWIEQRQVIANWYNHHLSNINELILPIVAENATHTYHLYVVRTEKRDALLNYLSEHEIGTLIHYPIPPHLQKAYSNLGFSKGDFPNAEEIADTCLSLPIWPGMQELHVVHVANTIKQFFQV
jgi:dTDP-4-amino-4,6-dideoxygalactose transaminase